MRPGGITCSCNRWPSVVAVLFQLSLTLFLAGSVAAETVLTIDQAREQALQFNRTYLSAKEEVVKAKNEIVKARAGALPEISATGTYSRNFILPSFFVQTNDQILEFRTGFKHNFGAAMELRQSLWQGGKVFTALAIARLYEKYSSAQARAVELTVLYNTDVLFYTALLARSRLEALEKEYEAVSHNADIVQKKYEQGMASQFELLRATVQKRNLEPAILKA
ncbi:MAG: TolC family protein, partial [Candidatus Zixiibacteriota bacterium]